MAHGRSPPACRASRRIDVSSPAWRASSARVVPRPVRPRQLSPLTRRSSAARSRSSGTSGGVTGGEPKRARAQPISPREHRRRCPSRRARSVSRVRRVPRRSRTPSRADRMRRASPGRSRAVPDRRAPVRAGAIATVESEECLDVPGLDPVGDRTRAAAATEQRRELAPSHGGPSRARSRHARPSSWPRRASSSPAGRRRIAAARRPGAQVGAGDFAGCDRRRQPRPRRRPQHDPSLSRERTLGLERERQRGARSPRAASADRFEPGLRRPRRPERRHMLRTPTTPAAPRCVERRRGSARWRAAASSSRARSAGDPAFASTASSGPDAAGGSPARDGISRQFVALRHSPPRSVRAEARDRARARVRSRSARTVSPRSMEAPLGCGARWPSQTASPRLRNTAAPRPCRPAARSWSQAQGRMPIRNTSERASLLRVEARHAQSSPQTPR